MLEDRRRKGEQELRASTQVKCGVCEDHYDANDKDRHFARLHTNHVEIKKEHEDTESEEEYSEKPRQQRKKSISAKRKLQIVLTQNLNK